MSYWMKHKLFFQGAANVSFEGLQHLSVRDGPDLEELTRYSADFPQKKIKWLGQLPHRAQLLEEGARAIAPSRWSSTGLAESWKY